jgi:Na+-driven multidrug efflux pump
MVVLLWALLFRRDMQCFGTWKMTFHLGLFRKIIKIGVPSGIQGSLDLLSWGVLISWLIGQFDHLHLAAQTVLVWCIRLSYVPADGMASGLATLVGHAQGRRDFLAAKRYTRWAFILNAVYMTTMALLFWFFRYPIMELFTDDPAVIEIGAQCMIWVALFQFFDAANVTHINALQGAGDTAWPSVMQMFLTIFILLGGGLYVVRNFPELASQGVWMVACLYVISQGIVYWARWSQGKWRRIRLMPEPTLDLEKDLK